MGGERMIAFIIIYALGVALLHWLWLSTPETEEFPNYDFLLGLACLTSWAGIATLLLIVLKSIIKIINEQAKNEKLGEKDYSRRNHG